MTLEKDLAELIVHATSGRKERILKAIREQGMEAVDETEASGYMNLKVMNDNGTMTRIFKTRRGDVKVQIWEPVEFRYSGVPTFEPSGRRSI